MSDNLDAALRTIDEYLDNPTQRAGDYAYPSERGDGSAGQCWRCRRNPTDDPAALCEGCRAFMLEDADEDPAAQPPRQRIGLEFGPPPTWIDVDPGRPVRLPADTRRTDLYTMTPANRRLGGISRIADEVPLHPQWMSPNELRRLMGNITLDPSVGPAGRAWLDEHVQANTEAAAEFDEYVQQIADAFSRSAAELFEPVLDALARLAAPGENLDPLERAQARRAQARAARDRGLPSARRPPRSMRP